MKRIIGLDSQLTELFADFDQVACGLKFKNICLLDDLDTVAKQTYAGIYRIDIATDSSTESSRDWIEELRGEWEHEDFKKRFTSNFKKKRIEHHSKKPLAKWMPLYVGKSKHIDKRVLEHVSLGLDKNTFALKIAARPSMANRSFRLQTLRCDARNYNLIMPRLESAIREHIHPLIGKQ